MASKSSQPISSGLNVYVRFRPLPVSTEDDSASTIALQYTSTCAGDTSTTKSSIQVASNPTCSRAESWRSPSVFSHIFTPSSANLDVYARIIKPHLEDVFRGQTCNFFAYGHSGSGKTHTIIGYDQEKDGAEGLCLQAGRNLMDMCDKLDRLPDGRDEDRLCIALRLYEIRGKHAHDLLNHGTQCHVREGPDGRTHIRGPTEDLPGGRVRVRPIISRQCSTIDELRTTILEGLAHRKTGASSVHHESSRTHAVLELEIVNQALIRAREELIERESDLVPVGKRATDVYLEEQMKSLILKEDGTYELNPERPVDQVRIESAEAEKAECEERVRNAEQDITTCIETYKQKGLILGGKIVFVDLAGAEYFDKCTSSSTSAKTKQTLQEQTQGRQINTDLFALKEVIRARARDEKRIPYRASALTMVLRGAFEGSNDGQVTSAMILTASSEESMWVATRNTLMYGGLVGEASGRKK